LIICLFIWIAEICPPADTAVEGFEFKKKEDWHAGDGVRISA
jgi:hypothetical protein